MAGTPASTRLAVYGSLAPGERHHAQLAHLDGTWEPGTVNGHLHDRGWAAGAGYPGIVLDASGPPVAVMVLTSEGLAGAWNDLDGFEGPEYQRAMASVDLDRGGQVLATIYELRPRFVGG